MKNFNYPVILMLLLLTVFSCTDDLNEALETVEEPSSLSFKPLSEIDNELLKRQLPKSQKHIKMIIDSDYNYLLAEHNLDGLFLDTDYIVVKNDGHNTSYTFLVVIPHDNKDESVRQHAYLTLNYHEAVNTDNQLYFGFQMDEYLSFDGEGNILNGDANTPQSEYTPKPKGLPSKAPKSVVCNYFSRNSPGTSSILVNYSGYSGYGGSVPAKQGVLDALIATQLTHNFND